MCEERVESDTVVNKRLLVDQLKGWMVFKTHNFLDGIRRAVVIFNFYVNSYAYKSALCSCWSSSWIIVVKLGERIK